MTVSNREEAAFLSTFTLTLSMIKLNEFLRLNGELKRDAPHQGA